MSKSSVPFGEVTYENPDNVEDVVTLYICAPAVIMETAELQKSFGSDGVNLESLAQVVSNFSQASL